MTLRCRKELLNIFSLSVFISIFKLESFFLSNFGSLPDICMHCCVLTLCFGYSKGHALRSGRDERQD